MKVFEDYVIEYYVDVTFQLCKSIWNYFNSLFLNLLFSYKTVIYII